MNKFDFLEALGESKNGFIDANLSGDDKEVIIILDILVARQLMSEKFKNELIELYLNKKINYKNLEQNISKSIKLYQNVELKVLSIDESAFNLKDDTMEYVGIIPKMLGQNEIINLNSGMVSYNFAKILCQRLQFRKIKLGEIIALSDCFDFNVYRIFNFEQLTK
jgi:hypothetical protein